MTRHAAKKRGWRRETERQREGMIARKRKIREEEGWEKETTKRGQDSKLEAG